MSSHHGQLVDEEEGGGGAGGGGDKHVAAADASSSSSSSSTLLAVPAPVRRGRKKKAAAAAAAAAGAGSRRSSLSSDGGLLTEDEEDDVASFPPLGVEAPLHSHRKRRGSHSHSRGNSQSGDSFGEGKGLLAHVHEHHRGGPHGGGGGGNPPGHPVLSDAELAEEEDDAPSATAANPLTMLIVFTTCNLLTYFDRGSIGVALGSIMKPEVYNLTNFEGGVLAGAYMFGYISASPIFALAVRKYDPFRLIAFGLSVWALAALGCACSIGFVSLLLARAVSGIGEAAFLCIAPPFIDRCAPSASKSRWMATFYCAIPIGYALGFVVSGHWLNVSLMGMYYQWRAIFVLEAGLMLPFIFWCLATETPPHSFRDPPPVHRTAGLDELNEPVSYMTPRLTRAQRRAQEAAAVVQAAQAQAAADAAGTTHMSAYIASVREVVSNRVYMLIIAGFSAQTFVIGSVAYFGVRYLMENFAFSVGRAGSYFGGITVVVGVFGSMFGGWLCDYMRRGKNKAHATATTMKLAFMLASLSFPLCLASFAKNDAGYFFTFFVVAEFILFATASPINSAVIWAVPFRLAPLACSLSIMFIHILGDAVSPAIVGAVLDATKNNWRLTMTLTTCWLLWSVLFWAWAWRTAEAKARKIDADMLARGMAPDADGQLHPDPNLLDDGGGGGMGGGDEAAGPNGIGSGTVAKASGPVRDVLDADENSSALILHVEEPEELSGANVGSGGAADSQSEKNKLL